MKITGAILNQPWSKNVRNRARLYGRMSTIVGRPFWAVLRESMDYLCCMWVGFQRHRVCERDIEQSSADSRKEIKMSESIRYESSCRILGWPLLAIARGADPARQDGHGKAHGIVAVGDVATGVFAVGGIARGVIAIGGLGFGLVTVAGVGIGALVIAGVSIAQTAFGGVAVGHYAKGGVAVGAHIVSSKRTDHSAAVWFSRLGLHPQETSQSSEEPATKPAE